MLGKQRGPALRVLLQFSRAKEAGDPYAFSFEPQDYTIPTEGGASPSTRFDWTQAVLDDLQALRLPGRDPALVQRMGERLRRFLLPAGWADWERQIAEALAAERPVFLTIRSSAAELYALPWELLTLRSGQFIGELDHVLLRFEWPETETAAEQPSPRPEGGRILVAWSAAAGAVPASDHITAIADACAAGFHPFDSDSDVVANASLPRLVQALKAAEREKNPVAVLHLLCHGAEAGSTFGLALDGEDGAAVVEAQQLRQHLAPFAKSLRLVVLSACDSGNVGALGNQLGSVARELHRCGLQAVIASRVPLSVAGSITLTAALYRALLVEPASLEAAFVRARTQLSLAESCLLRDQRLLDWASVQLYARHADGDDTRPVVFRPFRGLLAFQPEHQRFFFGRNREVAEVLRDLFALVERKQPRFLVVAGASGTGKSSLVLAGAVPTLLASDPQRVLLRMRPGRDPALALNEALAQLPAGAAGLLVVDQFEELFTQTSNIAEREALVRRLWSLSSRDEPDLRVIVTLRVDFIGRCGELVVNDDGLRLDRVAYDEQHRVFVAQLEPAQLRASIVEPARKVGLDLQDGLIDRMVHEVGGEPGALPLLEDALDVLWQKRSGRLLTQAAYDSLGGVVGALQMRADAILDRLAPADQALAQRLLISLVAVADDTALDTRLRVPVSTLRSDVAGGDPAGFERVLRDLVDARLLVQGDDKLAPTVEVAHEALIRKWPRLRAWLDEDRAGLIVQRRVRQAAEQWAQQGRDESLLYRGAQLAQAAEWRKTRASHLGELERSFLDHSEAQRLLQVKQAEERLATEQTRARQARIAAVVLAVLFVSGLGAAGLAYRSSREATRNAVQAVLFAEQAHQNAAQAQKNAEQSRDRLVLAMAQTQKRDPTTAALLIREARPLDYTLWTQTALDALRAGVADVVLRGHTAAVTAVAVSSDGKKIATGSKDQTARIWNADGSGVPVVLKGHDDAVTAIALSPDGKRLATGSQDKTLRVWNVDGSGTPLLLRGHKEAIWKVAYSSDGKTLAGVSWEGELRMWNADGSGTPIVLRADRAGRPLLVAISDGKTRLIGGFGSSIRIWTANESAALRVLQGHTSTVTAVALSSEGDRLVSGSEDNTARIWNADGSGTPLLLKGHESGVSSVAFSPDGETIATAGNDGTARLWSAEHASSLRVLIGHGMEVNAVAFSPDGMMLVTGSADQTARIWRVRGPSSPIVLSEHEDAVRAVAFSPDGNKLVTASADQTARIWNSDGSGTSIELNERAGDIDSVAFSPDGKTLALGMGDQAAHLFDVVGSGPPVVRALLRGHKDSIRAIAFSPDGKRLATASWDRTIRIWNVDGSGSPIVLHGHEEGVSGVAFSPDGTKLVTSSLDRTVRFWNADGSGAAAVLRGHDDWVSGVAFHPDGRSFATSSGDKTIRIWNANGKGDSQVLRGHTDAVTAIAFSPDGRRIATASYNATIRIQNADGTGTPIVLTGHQHFVLTIAFSPDGSKLASGSRDHTAWIWPVGSDALREALWNATSDCLPAVRRRELLIEAPDVAEQGYKRCRHDVARRRGWPSDG
ncbi:MAG: CHAT domain-containing protein [Myxococcales bacterium]|nr:CHAT domain-containing protein [Myxococcales bacterium]